MQWARWATKLYPRWWRERYGEEFAALLDDTRPGWLGACDVAKGALMLRMASWTPWRVFLGCALLGMAVSAAGWLAPPPKLTSRALIRVPDLESPDRSAEQRQRVAAAAQGLLSRTHLAAAIHAFDLYPSLRSSRSMEEVIEVMRSDISIEPVTLGPSRAVAVEFRYPGAAFSGLGVDQAGFYKAQRTSLWLAEELIRGDGGRTIRATAMHLLDAPTFPRDPTFDYRLLALLLGEPAGLIVGAIFAWTLWRIRGRGGSPPATSAT